MSVAIRMMLDSASALLATLVRSRLSVEAAAESVSRELVCIRITSLWRWFIIARS